MLFRSAGGKRERSGRAGTEKVTTSHGFAWLWYQVGEAREVVPFGVSHLGIAVLDQTATGAFQSEFSKIGQHRDPDGLHFGCCFLVVAGSSQAARQNCRKPVCE